MKTFIALALTIASTAALAQQQKITAEPVFNAPGFGLKEDLTIENKLVDLINQAVPGSTVRVAMYNFNRAPVAIALNKASQRGVDVRLVLDGNNEDNKAEVGNGTNILLQGTTGVDALKCTDDSCIKFCHGPIHFKIKGKTFGGSCNGFVINHNKFYLFSKLANGAENVVAQSSENLADQQMHMYNDLLIVKNDRALFDGMTAYWETLKRDHTHLTPIREVKGDGPITAHFFPAAIGHDPVMDVLNRVSCQLPGSIIRVSAADFTRESIAARLRDLRAQGCDVKVISRLEPSMFSPAKGVGTRLGHDLMVLPYKGKATHLKAKNSIHTKLMLIDASMNGSSEKIATVLTGSHNLDFFSLHTNDETMMEIQDRSIFNAYLKFWNRINDDARKSSMTLSFGDNNP